MMKRFFNRMLYALYCHYRIKNDSGIAAFHSKGVLAVGVGFYILKTYLTLKIANLIQYEWHMPNSKVVTGLILLIPCEIFIYFITDNSKVLESKFLEEGGEYLNDGWRNFYIFLAVES